MNQLKQKVGFGTALQGGGYQYYANVDKWKTVPFSHEGALPTAGEAIGWALMCAVFVGVMAGFLWM